MFYALPGVLTLSTTEWKDVRGKESSLLKGNQHGLKAGVLKWTDCCDLSMRSCDTQVVPQYHSTTVTDLQIPSLHRRSHSSYMTQVFAWANTSSSQLFSEV